MLIKIDDWLLWLTGQFVKKFNWLTGKDNFFLARVCCIVASFFWWAVAINNQSIALPMTIIALCAFPVMFWVVGLSEKRSEKERMAGVKENYRDFVAARFIRLFNLLCIIPFFICFLLPHHDISSCSIALGQSFFIAIFYLIGMDKPPYSRSRAWELLKGWFKAILSPLPVPELVPVPVAPGKN